MADEDVLRKTILDIGKESDLSTITERELREKVGTALNLSAGELRQKRTAIKEIIDELLAQDEDADKEDDGPLDASVVLHASKSTVEASLEHLIDCNARHPDVNVDLKGLPTLRLHSQYLKKAAFFDSKLSGRWPTDRKRKRQVTIDLGDRKDAGAVRAFLLMIEYNNFEQCLTTSSDAEEFLPLACEFLHEPIKSHCTRLLQRRINYETADEIAQLAEMYDCNDLLKEANALKAAKQGQTIFGPEQLEESVANGRQITEFETERLLTQLQVLLKAKVSLQQFFGPSVFRALERDELLWCNEKRRNAFTPNYMRLIPICQSYSLLTAEQYFLICKQICASPVWSNATVMDMWDYENIGNGFSYVKRILDSQPATEAVDIVTSLRKALPGTSGSPGFEYTLSEKHIETIAEKAGKMPLEEAVEILQNLADAGAETEAVEALKIVRWRHLGE